MNTLPSIRLTAPVQGSFGKTRSEDIPDGIISWDEHLEAYAAYAKKFGTHQSPETIANRCGFGYNELCLLLGRKPTTWKQRVKPT